MKKIHYTGSNPVLDWPICMGVVEILLPAIGLFNKGSYIYDYKYRYMKRFFDKIDKTETCWLWTAGSRGKPGYGSFKLNGKVIDAHRVSYIIHKGDIPIGMYVCHTCDNRICCNPAHLFLGTTKDNVQDMIKKGRKKTVKGSSCSWAKLTEDQIVKMLKLFEQGYTNAQVGKMFGIHRGSAGEIKRGEIWGHIGDRSRIIKQYPKQRRLNKNTAILVKQRLINKEKISDIAKDYNLTWRSIHNIKKEKTWKNIN